MHQFYKRVRVGVGSQQKELMWQSYHQTGFNYAEKITNMTIHEQQARTFDMQLYIQERGVMLTAIYRRLEWNAVKVNQPKKFFACTRTS